MLKNRSIRIVVALLIIILTVILVILLERGLVAMFGKNFVNIKDQHLSKYQRSISGDMNGGHNILTIKKYDSSMAIIRFDEAESYDQEPEINDFFVDLSVLDELEACIRKNKMNTWHQKRFNDVFVSDGNSTSYHFYFGKKDITFSSQIYPDKYSNKLRELDDIIARYLQPQLEEINEETATDKKSRININVKNTIKKADIWITPDTVDNRKLSLWGEAHLKNIEIGDEKSLIVPVVPEAPSYIVKMIDEDEMYYSAVEITLLDHQTIVIKEGEDVMTATVQVFDQTGELIEEYPMFMARL